MKALTKSLLLVALVCLGQQALAQDENKTLLKTEQIAARLGLDDSQKAELDKELKAAREERKALMERMRALREEMRRDAFVSKQSHMERMKEILTEEQLQKLKALRAQKQRQGMRQQMRGRSNERGRMEKLRMRRQEMMKDRMQEMRERREKGGGN